MCRSTDNHRYYQPERDRLKIKAFYLRFSISKTRKPLPESLTLLYLPRITGTPLEINESRIRSDSPAYVTLHRVRSAEKGKNREAVFASREVVRVSEGVQFEVYIKEEKVLKGIFRKDEGEDWNLELKCTLEAGGGTECGCTDMKEAKVSLVGDGHVEIDEKVDMMRRKKCRVFQGLEEIPEERDGCDCCCCGDEEEMESGSDGVDCEMEEELEGGEKEEMEMEMEGVRWAVDVGIWVMCLGVGFLVSKASSKRLRRRPLV